jgi:sec-independent protein translocase protein TatC
MRTQQDLFAEERSMAAMSLGDHIEELRRRLILALLGLVVGVIVTLTPPLNLGRMVVRRMEEPAQRVLAVFYADDREARIASSESAGSYKRVSTRIPIGAFAQAVRQVFPDLPAPAIDALQARYVELPQEWNGRETLAAVDAIVERDDSLIALGPMEPAVIFFRVCLATGLVVASPWVFYQVWAFIAAGLYRHERALVYTFLPYSLGLFLAGVFLCFFAVLPLTLRFLLEFNVWLGIKPMLRLSEWMGFATILPLAFGLCFQAPLVMLLLAKIGIFTAADYRAKRRLSFLIIVIVAALLTPGPDYSSMLLLSLPMLLLYELGILLVGRSGPGALEVM